MKAKARVVLYTKTNCSLCEKMKAQIKLADCDELYSLEEVDIERDAELFALYRYEIPVLCIDGVEAFRYRLKADEFRKAIRRVSDEG
ncbi:MAG TPA: glutaredoxin family protein [Pyrinomonadaceae bacterium]|nr:glutaredoxin family protein [Pyrinomonadaceae bacterium]